MTWARFDDGWWIHPKTLAAGNAAAGVLARMVVYCCAQLTDGAVPKPVALMIAGPDSEAIPALLRVGSLTESEGSYLVHDFLDWNPSADSVRQGRAKDAARKKGMIRRDRTGIQRESARIPDGVQSDSCPFPDIPDIPKPVSREEERKNVPAPIESAPSPGLVLIPTNGSEKKARKAKWVAPFEPYPALRAIEETAEGRFTAGEERDLTAKAKGPIYGAIRVYPTLEEWRTVGRYLASPQGAWIEGQLGPDWVQREQFRGAMAKARSWANGGGAARRRTAAEDGYDDPREQADGQN